MREVETTSRAPPVWRRSSSRTPASTAISRPAAAASSACGSTARRSRRKRLGVSPLMPTCCNRSSTLWRTQPSPKPRRGLNLACRGSWPPQHTSVWAATAQLPTYSPLTSDTATDVCVVGAGISGLTTAYLLTQVGKSVVVLDDGADWQRHDRRRRPRTSSMRSTIGFSISSGCMASAARGLPPKAHTAAIDRIESIVARERIDVRLHPARRLSVLRAGTRRGPTSIASWRLRTAPDFITSRRLGRAPLAFDTGPCLRFPNQAQFHPLKYLAGMADAIERAGGRIYSGTHATSIDRRLRRGRVTTKTGAVRARTHRGRHQHSGQRSRRRFTRSRRRT